MELTWLGSHHDDLTARQMHDLLRLRHRVFVIEQDCPEYEDIDGLDVAEGTRHVLGSEGDRLLAYARVVAPGAQSPQARIGRVVVSGEARGTGVGHTLMRETLALCERVWPGQELMLAAQAHLADDYGRYGFAPVGEVYVEDGIDHLDMVRPS